MKIFMTMLICFLVVHQISSQITQGTVKYKHTTYFESENMPSDMPKSIDAFMQLTFTENESIYQKDPDIKVEESTVDQGRFMRRMRDRTNRIYHKNLETEVVTEQVGLFNKEFLVLDSIANIRWKVSTGEQKEILGYNCMKASYKDSTVNIVVYFTTQIPVPSGPEKYGKLPGMILELQSAQSHIIATAVDVKSVVNPIILPSKGDKMTRTEFDRLRKEKMKEQREMWGRREGSGRPNRN